MRHKKNTKKFKRTEENRKKLWQDLVTGLIINGRITTFSSRAKWSAAKFERLVTLVKRAGDDKKLAFTKVRPYLKEDIARKLIEDIAPKMQERSGGYTQIYKLHDHFTLQDKSIVLITE